MNMEKVFFTINIYINNLEKKPETKTKQQKPYDGGYKKNFKNNFKNNKYQKEGNTQEEREQGSHRGRGRGRGNNRYYNTKRGNYNQYKNGGKYKNQRQGAEAVEVEYKEVVTEQKTEVPVVEAKEMPQNVPEVESKVDNIEVEKKEEIKEKIPTKSKAKKTNKNKEHLSNLEKETEKAPEEEIITNQLLQTAIETKKKEEEQINFSIKNNEESIFNPVKGDQLEIVKEKKKESPKVEQVKVEPPKKEKTFVLERSQVNFSIETENKPQPKVQPQPQKIQPPQQQQIPSYPYPMFMYNPAMQGMDPKNQNGQLYYVMVPMVPYETNGDQSGKPKMGYPLYPYPQQMQGEQMPQYDYTFSNPYGFPMMHSPMGPITPQQMYGKQHDEMNDMRNQYKK